MGRLCFLVIALLCICTTQARMVHLNDERDVLDLFDLEKLIANNGRHIIYVYSK